jgi:menaquinone-dependent protoporphyrinogen oxidase
MNILIVYAGKYGTTLTVCDILKSRFDAAGDEGTISRADALVSPEPYDALVLACPLYFGKWIKYFAEYIERYKAHMNDQPVAVCTIGYSLKDGDEKNLNIAKNATSLLRAYTKPVIEGYFAGRVDMNKLSIEDKAIAVLARVEEGDYLDTEAVATWADETRKLLISSRKTA